MATGDFTAEQIEETFRRLGLDSEEARRRFDDMRPRPEQEQANLRYSTITSDNTRGEAENLPDALEV